MRTRACSASHGPQQVGAAQLLPFWAGRLSGSPRLCPQTDGLPGQTQRPFPHLLSLGARPWDPRRVPTSHEGQLVKKSQAIRLTQRPLTLLKMSNFTSKQVKKKILSVCIFSGSKPETLFMGFCLRSVLSSPTVPLQHWPSVRHLSGAWPWADAPRPVLLSFLFHDPSSPEAHTARQTTGPPSTDAPATPIHGRAASPSITTPVSLSAFGTCVHHPFRTLASQQRWSSSLVFTLAPPPTPTHTFIVVIATACST